MSATINTLRKSLPRMPSSSLPLTEAQKQRKAWMQLLVDSEAHTREWDVLFDQQIREYYAHDTSAEMSDISINEGAEKDIIRRPVIDKAHLPDEILIGKEAVDLVKQIGTCAKYRKEQWLATTGAMITLSVSKAFKDGCRDIPAEKLKEIIAQIKIDVPRTIPYHPLFQEDVEDPTKNGRLILERVLVAFVFLHPDTNYLQGMNFIAAMLLITFEMDEDKALTVLSNILCQRFPGYFTDFSSLTRDTAILKYFLSLEDPQLYAHLLKEDMDFDIATVSPNWLLTLYFNVLPPKLVLRIWDGLFCSPTRQSSGYLIRVGLSIFNVIRKDLLESESLSDVYQHLQNLQSRFEDPNIAEMLLQDIFHSTAGPMSDSNLDLIWKKIDEEGTSNGTMEDKWNAESHSQQNQQQQTSQRALKKKRKSIDKGLRRRASSSANSENANPNSGSTLYSTWGSSGTSVTSGVLEDAGSKMNSAAGLMNGLKRMLITQSKKPSSGQLPPLPNSSSTSTSLQQTQFLAPPSVPPPLPPTRRPSVDTAIPSKQSSEENHQDSPATNPLSIRLSMTQDF